MVFYAVIFSISYLVKTRYSVDCLFFSKFRLQGKSGHILVGRGESYSRGRNLQGKTGDEGQYRYL